MKTYMFAVLLQTEVQAPNEADAREILEDTLGKGESCGLNVAEFEVLDSDEL